MPGVVTVLRPAVVTVPGPAWIYCAFGLGMKYPTVLESSRLGSHLPLGRMPDAGQVCIKGTAMLAVPLAPFGLKIARSPAASPLRFESVALSTVAGSPDSQP